MTHKCRDNGQNIQRYFIKKYLYHKMSNYLTLLPLELQFQYLYHLNLSDLARLSDFDPAFMSIFNDDNFWRHYVRYRYDITEYGLLTAREVALEIETLLARFSDIGYFVTTRTVSQIFRLAAQYPKLIDKIYEEINKRQDILGLFKPGIDKGHFIGIDFIETIEGIGVSIDKLLSDISKPSSLDEDYLAQYLSKPTHYYVNGGIKTINFDVDRYYKLLSFLYEAGINRRTFEKINHMANQIESRLKRSLQLQFINNNLHFSL